jgi:hypothetical protein
MRFIWLFIGWVGLAGVASAAAQGRLWARLERNVEITHRGQPDWATPLVTVSPRPEEGFRTDFSRQSTAGGRTAWNYGGAKGLQFLPLPRMELRLSPPPFFAHSNPKLEDGFGDVAFRLKYRLYGSAESSHDAIVTAELGASLPTGKSGNGSCCAVMSPTLEAGKGFGRLALTASAGGTLPVSGVTTLGRQVVLNEAIQYHATQYRGTRLLWLETEFNSTLYRGGRNDGKAQTFVTPGLVVSRIRLRGRLKLTLGAGEQIALTRFYTYNHSPIFSGRMRF